MKDWFFENWFPFVLVILTAALFCVLGYAVVESGKEERTHDQSEQNRCKQELNGIIVPSSEGWVCAVPNTRQVEK